MNGVDLDRRARHRQRRTQLRAECVRLGADDLQVQHLDLGQLALLRWRMLQDLMAAPRRRHPSMASR